VTTESDPPQSEPKGERTTHKGVHWWRDRSGRVSFYDDDAGKWVRWSAGGDAPPLPPKWQLLGVPTRVTRPGWRSPWRIVPAVLIVAAVVIAILQVTLPSTSNAAKEAKAAEALLGKCLPNHGSGLGSKPVPCDAKQAAVKVVLVLPTTPGSPLCPSGTHGTYLPYAGVRYLHVECVVPVPPTG
jgi:hypothetical protein